MFLNSKFVVNKIILHSEEPQRKALVFRFIVFYFTFCVWISEIIT